MESIYYVLSWLCHRTCAHCYDDRFRPYYGPARERVVAESETNFRRVIENLPDRMTYLDPADEMKERRGRIILAGGEVLLDPIRETVLYPTLDLLYEKYRNEGGVNLVVQTTGDLLNEKLVTELLDHHAVVISVSGMDDYHDGIRPEAQFERLTRLFDALGVGEMSGPKARAYYQIWGATSNQWIGKLWPRGRAHLNELSTASLADNFCNGWSGGLNFLQPQFAGSEVSIEPNGNVYPCCMKTLAPIGNLLVDKLDVILDRLMGNPVYEAISMGHPERMGITHGWPVETFFEKSTVTLPSGRRYQNLCLGCDAFHREVLMPGPLVSICAP